MGSRSQLVGETSMAVLDDLPLGRYVPAGSCLHRLDPRVKFAFLPVLVIASFAADSPSRFAGLAALALLAAGHPQGTPHLIGLALFIVIGAPVLGWVLVRFFRPVYHGLSRLMGRFSWLAGRRYRMARGTVDFLRALRAYRSLSRLERIGLFLLSVGYWLPRYLVPLVAVSLVTGRAPAAYLFLLQGLLNLGGQMFLLPAGGGGVDAAYLALTSPLMGHADGAFTLLIWRAFTFYWYLLVGGPIFLLKTGKAARELMLGKSRTQNA